MALEYNTVSVHHQKNRGPQNRRTALLAVVACSQYPSFESVTGLNAPAPQMDFTIMIGALANGGEE